MIDYDASRAKVKKLVEKPADDMSKLPRAQTEHDEAKEIFSILNDQLIAELPLLVDLRIRKPLFRSPMIGVDVLNCKVNCLYTAYLDPSFEAMIRCQLKFAEEGYEKLSGVQR